MNDKFLAKIKLWCKSLLALVLVGILALGNAHSALAARSGGRIGGGSFSSPGRVYSSPGGSYRGYGGGIGFPFLLPFLGFGGGFGTLFTLLIFGAIANFLMRSFSNVGVGEEELNGYSNSTISVAEVQVGLLAEARSLQKELNQIALKADTGSAQGRMEVLQEATLALLRHPEYWVYGSTQAQQTSLVAAEAKFNQLALAERSKFGQETLSNVNSSLKEALKELSAGDDAQVEDGGEYIMVTLIVGVNGKLAIPTINGEEDLRQALKQIGSIGAERLLAIEVLWTPQAVGDTLSRDDILANYANVKLV